MTLPPPDLPAPEERGFVIQLDRGPRTIPWSEFTFTADTSGGPGGQHANRSATRVSLVWSPGRSAAFSQGERQRLTQAFAHRIDSDGTLRIRVSNERSQGRNKRACLEILEKLIQAGLRPQRKRVATRPTRASKKRRVENKRRRSQTKSQRRKPGADD